jgi:trigger factor
MGLDVNVQDLPNSQKKLEILVSSDECTKAYEKVLSKLAKEVTIPGFRKGKAPAAMVLNHFGKKSVSAEACEEIIGASIPLALQQKDIRAIGQAKMAVRRTRLALCPHSTKIIAFLANCRRTTARSLAC